MSIRGSLMNDFVDRDDGSEDGSEDGEDEDELSSAGCTAVVAIVVGNQKIIVANAGDSRAVLCDGEGKAVPLSWDHKPTNDSEYDRIVKAGGAVIDGRVNGSLNLSRAIGDLEYKRNKKLPPGDQIVTAVPDIAERDLQAGDAFLLVACDGIWDVLNHQEAIDFCRERLAKGTPPKKVCEELCDRCLAPDTGGMGKGCDNMTVVITKLPTAAV